MLSDLELKINEQREIWIFGNFSVLVVDNDLLFGV